MRDVWSKLYNPGTGTWVGFTKQPEQQESEPMYERFTDRARKVMQFAQQEAQRFYYAVVDTPHVLIGLIKEGSGVAAHTLKKLDVDLGRLRFETEKLLASGIGHVMLVGRLPHTARVTRMVEHAVAEARDLNHNYVGTEHLLLGMLRGFNEPSNGESDDRIDPAARILAQLGVEFLTVREEVMNLLGHNIPEATKSDGQEESSPEGANWPKMFTVNDPLPASWHMAVNGRAYSDAAYCALVQAATTIACSRRDGDEEIKDVIESARRFLIGEFGVSEERS